MTIDDTILYGKYAGYTIRELLRNKKGLYLMWMLRNIKNFHIEPKSIEESIVATYEKQYLIVYKHRR